ncbi:MAG: hypothetical protein Q7T44_05625 [Parvibaculum sp.]|nr:hypothetical protein [Parvibaculum sp.]
MAHNRPEFRESRSFMGASTGFRLLIALACLAALWSGVWWALA